MTIVRYCGLAIGTVLGFANVAWGVTYEAAPTSARVVDDESGAAIPGVIVVADWEVCGGTLHCPPRRTIEIAEAVTDSDGRFVLPGWAPRTIPPTERLGYDDPILTFLKSGYEPHFESNLGVKEDPPSLLRRSFWDGKVIRIKPERPSMRVVDEILGRTYPPFESEGCLWKKMPRLLAGLLDLTMQVPDGGAKSRDRVVEQIDSRIKRAECGSLADAVRVPR